MFFEMCQIFYALICDTRNLSLKFNMWNIVDGLGFLRSHWIVCLTSAFENALKMKQWFLEQNSNEVLLHLKESWQSGQYQVRLYLFYYFVFISNYWHQDLHSSVPSSTWTWIRTTSKGCDKIQVCDISFKKNTSHR